MKIYITGSVGSGKSTLARRLGHAAGIPYFQLDEVMYEPDPDDPGDNRKRDPIERDAIFSGILARESWIIEDAGRDCFRRGMDEADELAVLELPQRALYLRVIMRWIKQRIGIEKCIYRPDITMLRSMLRWVGEYDATRLSQYAHKAIRLHTSREISAYINSKAASR